MEALPELLQKTKILGTLRKFFFMRVIEREKEKKKKKRSLKTQGSPPKFFPEAHWRPHM